MDKIIELFLTGLTKKKYKSMFKKEEDVHVVCYLCERAEHAKSVCIVNGRVSERSFNLRLFKLLDENGEHHFFLCDECCTLLEAFIDVMFEKLDTSERLEKPETWN